MKGFDCAAVAAPYAKALAAAGYEFAARYYRRTLVADSAVSPREAAALFAEGLWLLSVFEGGKLAVQPEYYTAENGSIDVAAALAKAEQMQQPRGTAIYFAVDANPAPGRQMDSVKRYFERCMGAGSIGGYRVGVYGSGLVLDTLLSANLAEVGWLANATGWYGSRDYDGWVVHQTSLPKRLPFGLEVDEDVARDPVSAGLWRLGSGRAEASLVDGGR